VWLSGCRPRDLVSTSQEVQIGQQASQEIDQKYRLVTDPALNQMVNNIGQTLVRYSDRQDIKYTFKILDVPDVNAFSLPGGWVYVDKGLIDNTKGNIDELAGVISHEIGHVVARHHADMIGRQVYANILIGTLTQGQISQIASVFANISLLQYSRQQEYAADRLGIKQMFLSKQYNPQGLINFFNNLLKLEGNPPSQFEQIFRTHPTTQDRITAAQDYLNGLKNGTIKP
jgi:predicted Zn-dependent protease